jgi:hypothetical protein
MYVLSIRVWQLELLILMINSQLRTHTGARPYICQEPGCEKAFARPDQLQRHMNVHKKAAISAIGSAGTSMPGVGEGSASSSMQPGDHVGVMRRGHSQHGTLRASPYDKV